MQKSTLWLIIGFIALVVVAILIVNYNKLSSLDEGVQTAWTPLQAKIQERYASVPRLLSDVTLYVGKEIKQVKEIKNFQPHISDDSSISDKVKAANKVENMLQSLIQFLGQRYPGIMSNHSIQMMAQIMRNTDNTIGAQTTAFNTAAEGYNAKVRRFPTNLVALVLGFTTKYDYFAPQKG